MKPFAYLRPGSVAEAVRVSAERPGSRFLGGGTNLVDLMKLGVETPGLLIDVSRLPLDLVTATDDG
ncbi:FAD binding domain-containing protein, partial [Streptomyces sp. NRRL WC-3549]|uniref:FAD binding domain-containing protein n=1 Tax=Streptomyces sp. NRRL WC-3549 TaxID=1463925 RepID=UPI0004C67155